MAMLAARQNEISLYPFLFVEQEPGDDFMDGRPLIPLLPVTQSTVYYLT